MQRIFLNPDVQHVRLLAAFFEDENAFMLARSLTAIGDKDLPQLAHRLTALRRDWLVTSHDAACEEDRESAVAIAGLLDQLVWVLDEEQRLRRTMDGMTRVPPSRDIAYPPLRLVSSTVTGRRADAVRP